VLLSAELLPWQNRVGALEVGASQKSKLVLGNCLQPFIYFIYFIALFVLIKAFIPAIYYCVPYTNVLVIKITIKKGILIHAPLSVFPT